MPDRIQTEKIGKLGFGYMRLPVKGGAYDTEQINRMADAFLGNGGTYFDAAFIYEGAEEALRDTVVKRYPGDRGKIQIATKLSLHAAKSLEDMKKHFQISLDRLGTDYIDFYLLHGLDAASSGKGEELGAWEYLKELKSKGLIRHIGFSFHGTPEDLDEIFSKHPEAEFVQPQINYLDWDGQRVQARRLHEVTRKYDIPIVAMEPLRGGLLASADSPITSLLRAANPGASPASWALRFVAQLEGVIVTLSGMSSLDQVTDNVATFADLKPLSSDEMALLDKAVEIINSVPRIDCTSCRYCVKECPSNIAIPNMIGVYNDYLAYKTTAGINRPYWLFTRNAGKAGDCTACKACEEICTQKLEIAELMKVISGVFDNPGEQPGVPPL